MNEADVHSTAHATARRANLVPGHHNKDKLAMWFFIGGEVILFTAVTLSYVLFRITYSNEYANFRSHLSIPLIGLNTFILVLSSYFVVRALNAVKQDRVDASLINLLIVLALGALFLTGQAYEWSQLFAVGIKQSNTFGPPFYVLTGIHGAHVLVGLAWASIVLFFGIGGAYKGGRYRAVEFFGLYWHFVDIVWIVLFSMIYLI